MKELCNRDCFNCIYDDECILGEDDYIHSDYYFIKEEESKLNRELERVRLSSVDLDSLNEQERKRLLIRLKNIQPSSIESRKKYYSKNKERINSNYKSYYERNKEAIKAKRKARYEANKDEINALRRAKNAEKRRANENR